jgi:hypothetical protein
MISLILTMFVSVGPMSESFQMPSSTGIILFQFFTFIAFAPLAHHPDEIMPVQQSLIRWNKATVSTALPLAFPKVFSNIRPIPAAHRG